ncbi:GNAT family N-acetyltransferase [Neobacillus dielmonensis]|uniref:GNAT family N-acetyltransferase n=1 Tax=Neobacillus dielmonensis TaxID=1347369 RepID=UPI001F3D68C6|nr:GNAT family N-acetyltransferase [Neobacillus dielmonensis]
MMNITYEVLTEEYLYSIQDLCNELMAYQKTKASIHPEFFENMSFETRMIPSVQSATANYIITAKVGEKMVGYAYSNISPKETYSGGFATLNCDAFFDFGSVQTEEVGCLSQFYIKEDYRSLGIGSTLFQKSMDWLQSFETITDHFIFVSNGNDQALKFYQRKGFTVSHHILDGFITVLRNN